MGGLCHTLHGNADRTVVVIKMQNTTGTLSPGAHPGSYNGQDAYNDMLVTNGTNHGIGTGERRNHAGGVSNIERKPRTADYDV